MTVLFILPVAFVHFILYNNDNCDGEVLALSEWMTIQDAAAQWGISKSLLARLCREGRIVGAEKVKGAWMIPADAQYPADGRRKPDTALSKQASRARRLLPLPIGISDYRKASAEYYYIDKTLMIRDFLDEVPMVSLFTRPRRFGKTLNMDMLKTFFEKTGEDTSRYFTDRKIWKCGKAYRDHQGKYPVVFLTFKDVKCATWDETYDLITKLIIMEYRRHAELDADTNPDRDSYRKIISGQASGNEFMLSLMMLTKMLHEYHSIEPIVIIDEYDTPIQQGYSCGFYDEAILFIRNLFSGAFKDNKHLKYGFLTGILRVAKESIFSGLNNIKINSILDDKYSGYFGFTPEEVQEMAEYYSVSERYAEICDWYDGYRFGHTEIFNPWSVVNYFSNACKPGPYWLSTGSNDIIGEILSLADEEIYERLHALLQRESFLTYVDTSVIYPQIQKNPSSVYSFLLVAGYLKAEETSYAPSGDFICRVSLPNREISFVYNKEILSKLDPIVPQSLAIAIQEAICANDVSRLKTLLEKLLRESVSYYDTAKETFYHGLILGLCALFSSSYTVTSNRESGEGRYDIQLMPGNTADPGFIFELKAEKNCSGDELKALADRALKQIVEKKYAADMTGRGIRTIVQYGVAFSGKSVELRMAETS